MACNCIDEIPKRIKNHLNQQDAYKNKPVLKASFKDVIFPINDQFEIRAALKTDVMLTIEGRKTPKKHPFIFVFCPFCGERYKPKEE